jgi:parallel beta-helix repeat protein
MKANLFTVVTVAFLALALPATLLAANTVTTCGTVIAIPGTWTVVNNLNCPGLGVAIQVNNVVLKLNGFTIAGPGPASGTGVLVVSSAGFGLKNVRIVGPGAITNFAAGIFFLGTIGGGVTDATLSNNGNGLVSNLDGGGVQSKSLLITQNQIVQNINNGIEGSAINTSTIVGNNASNNGTAAGGSGIWLGMAATNTVQGNICNNNFTDGIRLGGAGGNGATGNIVLGNQTNNNSSVGIGLESPTVSDHFSGNVAFGNAVFDISDSNPSCGSNTYKSDVFGTANQACIK